MNIAITGASGFIGRALVRELVVRGHTVRLLVRPGVIPGPGSVRWNPDADWIDIDGLDGIDALVHLAGEGIVDKRWTAAQKERIRLSRSRGTRLVAEALASMRHPPSVLVSGSAIGWYGPAGDHILTEESPPGSGFLAQVCGQWEDATQSAARAGIRVAIARSGIVLAPHGGALKRFQLPFRLGLGGRIGDGTQFMSWITLRDEVRSLIHIVESGLSGPFNLTAPAPVRNREFTEALASVLRRPAFLPVPMALISAVLGAERASELAASQRVLPARLQESGFVFSDADCPSALGAMLTRRSPASR